MRKYNIGFALIFVMMLSMLIFFPVISQKISEGKIEVNNLVIFLASLGPISGLILWMWMIVDYFSNKDRLRHKILWGLVLFIANWIASIIYFLFIYLPREKGIMSYKKK